MRRARNWTKVLLTVIVWSPLAAARESTVDDLAQRPTWTAPKAAELRQQLDAWPPLAAAEPAVRQSLESIWVAESPPGAESPLERVVQSVAFLDARAAELIAICQQPRRSLQLEDPPVLADQGLPAWIRANLRLYYAQWLTTQQFYNEAQELLNDLQPEQVCDPAALLFYQGVVYHRLLDKQRSLAALDRLLANEAAVPQRYVKLARLMEADLRPLKPDSLDEVARLMESIKVRLGHGRAGKRVRQEEQDVIAKLDKMIEQCEREASAAAAAAANTPGGAAPSSPMQDSSPGGQSGPGNVAPKKLGARTDWGNLPPQEREEALQQLGKDLPSHYRDVIEEYFRKLARDGVQP